MSEASTTPVSPVTLEMLEEFSRRLTLFNRERAERGRMRRSTYSQAIADRMLPFYKRLMDNPCESLVISRKDEFRGNSLHTVYLKWVDGLLWLLECKDTDDNTRSMAAQIKIQFRASEDYERDALVVKLRSKRDRITQKNLRGAIAVVHKAPSRLVWKEALLEYITAGEAGVPFVQKDLALSVEDMEFVRALCEQNQWSHVVTVNEIRVVKD